MMVQPSTPDGMSLNDLEKGDTLDEKDLETLEHHPVGPDTTRQAPSEAIPTQERDNTKPEPRPESNFHDWNGPEDPDNPYNWPNWQRWYHSAAPALLGFAVTFGTSVYTPAVPDVMHQFNVSRTVAILGLSLYTLGLGFGPTITAPLSEGHGRRIVYLVSSPIFMLFTLGAGFSKSFYSLAICRFFAAMAGSPALAVGSGTNADLFPPQQRAVVSIMYLAAPFSGPALGPVVGGFAAQYKGWRWTQWCLIFVTLAAFALALPMKETYKPIILKQRAKRLGITSPVVEGVKMKGGLAKKLLRPMHMLFTEPLVFFFAMYTSFAFGVLFLFLAAFPYIFQRAPYHFTASQTGLTFISFGIGVFLASVTTMVLDRVLYQKQWRKAFAAGKTNVDPEHRLYPAMIASCGIVIGLFWFGWCAGTGQHWAVAVVGAIPFAWGNLCLFTSAVLYMLDVYGPLNGASAMAANGVSRYTFGAVFPLFAVQMYETLGIGWATSLLGFLALLMLPIPFVFFKYGAAIRQQSRYPKIV